MQHQKFFCGVVAFLASAASAGEYCTSGGNAGRWVNTGGCSNAFIVVEGPGDPNLTGDSVTISQVSGRWNITIAFADPISGGTDHSVIVWSDAIFPQDIGTLSISVGGVSSQDDDTVLLTFQGPSSEFANITHVGQITYSGVNCGGLAVQGRIQGDFGGAGFGATLISQIGYVLGFRVDGDVLSKITVDGEPTKSGGPQAENFFIQGDYLADLEVVTGGIGNLEVIGSIGSFDGNGNPVPVRIGTRDAIEKIKAGQIVATIVAGDSQIDPQYSAQRFAQLIVTNDDGGTGTLHGSITASEMRYNSNDPGSFSIEGNFGGGTIQLLDTLELPAQIRIGGSLASTGMISLPTNGLSGTVLINAENGTGTWQSGGQITIGSATLTSTTFSTTSTSSIGGGVAGVAPSGIYGQLCGPTNGLLTPYWPSTYTGDCDNPPPLSGSWPGGFHDALIQFGGSVQLSSTPFTIERVPGGASFVNATDVTNQYQFKLLGETDTPVTINESRVRIYKSSGRAFDPGYEYRIRATTGGVKLKSVTGTPDIGFFNYQFGTYFSCDLGLLSNFDLNQDDSLCSQDIAAWMSEPVDFDGDEVADSTDLGYLVNGVSVWQNR